MKEAEAAKESARRGMELFLRNFAHVPDDKLHYRAAPTAKTPLRIAAHTALYYSRFANMIRERRLPAAEDTDAWVARCEAEEEAVTDRHEMEQAFRAGLDEVISAIDGLSEQDIAGTLESGQGWSMSMRFLIGLPGWHATLHLGQIDFLQTCWGDLHVYLD